MKKRDGILRLKYRLEEKEDGSVIFQILKQDNRIRHIYKQHYCPPKMFGVFNGWGIESWDCPEIRTYERKIFLRGANSDSDLYICEFYESELINDIHKALELFIKSKFGNCKVVKG
jgi:hypothetical protein